LIGTHPKIVRGEREPTIIAPNIGALSDASAASGAATKAITASVGTKNNTLQPSILIVEIEGYGGSNDGSDQTEQPQQKGPSKKHQQQSQNGDDYDPDSAVELLGNGKLSENQETNLTPAERARLDNVVGSNP
jgi:filamentous hemagglutinin